MTRTLIIGHRGASREAPENTLASFRLAFQEGADGIEADFRLTSDGRIVCLHDESTARTAGGDLRVAGAGWHELRALDAGGWKGEPWRGERIPSFAEVLGALPPGKLVFIELKGGAEMVPALGATLAESGVDPERVRFLSFDASLVRTLKELLPAYRCCWLVDYRWRAGWHPDPAQVLETLRGCRADGLASRSRAVLDPSFVAALRRESFEIHVWTVDRAAEARRLCALGVDSIMTNRPGWLRARLAKPGTASHGIPA